MFEVIAQLARWPRRRRNRLRALDGAECYPWLGSGEIPA